MTAYLIRQHFRSDGIFGTFHINDLDLFCLEHAFTINNQWEPKLPVGEYECTRYLSPHFGYDVFMLQNVPNVTALEIHRGNYNDDSKACICIGLGLDLNPPIAMITQSQLAFEMFMKELDGINNLQLVVQEQRGH